MRQATLTFLIKDQQVLLIKVQYLHRFYWNGVSGFIDGEETPEQASAREIDEEIGLYVLIKDLEPVYLLDEDGQKLHVFFCSSWKGEPKCNEETIKEVQWFKIDEIPYEHMHMGTKQWLDPLLSEYLLLNKS